MKNIRIMPVASMMGVLAMAALPASAGDFGFSLNIGTGHHGEGVALGLHIGDRPRPVRKVWVEPVYQTVTDRIWVPTMETRFRDVPVTDALGNVISYRREAYSVASGYWQETARQVLVEPGHWTTVPVMAQPVVAAPVIVPAPVVVPARPARPVVVHNERKVITRSRSEARRDHEHRAAPRNYKARPTPDGHRLQRNDAPRRLNSRVLARAR